MEVSEHNGFDDTLDKMFSQIPPQPMILDIPSQAPLHVPPLQVEWEYRNSLLFSRDELHLQHLSFKRKLDTTSLVTAEFRDLVPQSGTSRPKKKISLADYKMRKVIRPKSVIEEHHPNQEGPTKPRAMGNSRMDMASLSPLFNAASFQAPKRHSPWSLQLVGQASSQIPSTNSTSNKRDSNMDTANQLKEKFEQKLDSIKETHGQSGKPTPEYKEALSLGADATLCALISITPKGTPRYDDDSFRDLLKVILARMPEESHVSGLCHALNAAGISKVQDELATGDGVKLEPGDHLEKLRTNQSSIIKSTAVAEKILDQNTLKEMYPDMCEKLKHMHFVRFSPEAARIFGMTFLKEWKAQEGLT